MNAVPAYGRQKVPVFLLARDDQILIGDGGPLTLTTADVVSHPAGREYPHQLDFHWQPADASRGRVHLALREPALIEAVSLLTAFPRWQQRLLRLFANPYYFRFNAALELQIDLPGLQMVEQGRALYEIMLLR